MAALLAKYQDVFSKYEGDVGRTDLVKHSIPLIEGARPIRQPPHRLGPLKEAEADRQVTDLLEKGLIEPANGAWSSPVVMVRKKDGGWRFCVDYRQLNAITQQDAYPIPRIDESLDALAGSRFFSTLDLTSGYWQVPMDQEAQERSAFTTRSGLWKWKVLPFGLTSAPATFQRLMESVLQGLHWKTLLLYLDDIIVIAPDFETHLARLEEVFRRLATARLKLKPSKCELLQEKVKYLGHVVSPQGVSTDPEKIKAVAEWRVPQNVKQLQAFLGTTGYYRQYLKDYATTAKPLTVLTGKGKAWQWGNEEQAAFETLRRGLVTAPVLGYPNPGNQYILDTDASNVGVGAVLSQNQNGRETVVAYYSKTLSPAEQNYCVTRKELLAVVKAVKHFRPYLYGQRFLLRTDHASLRWLCRRREPSAQVARWLEILSEFTYQLEHRPGAKHGNADGLSRQACPEDCRQCTRIEERDGGPSKQAMMKGDPNKVAAIKLPGERNFRQLVQSQMEGNQAVARMYWAVKNDQEFTEETLTLGNNKLRILHRRREAMRLSTNGVLEIRLITNGHSRWCTLCPRADRNRVIWETHRLAHAGVHKTTKRVLLNWYWPGLSADIRRLIKTCEVCQVAKTGGNHATKSRHRLYAGRPWQKLAVDLVGPMPETEKGNKWILVISDHFSRWQDAIAIPDATAPVVATTLDERVFCYFGLPEELHSDQGAQFESKLMSELCRLWNVTKTRTTPYHPQGNGIVERNNRSLGDSLRALLLRRGPTEWDLLLPQIMRAFRATPHSATGETANFMMMGRELRLPDQLSEPVATDNQAIQPYVLELAGRLEETHEILRERQMKVRVEDEEEPPLFEVGDLVLLVNKRRRRGENPKLQPKYVGPYTVTKRHSNNTYQVERQGQVSVQNEERLKPYIACPEADGRAPATREPARRPNMRGATGNRKSREEPIVLLPTLEFHAREPAFQPPLQPRDRDPLPAPSKGETFRRRLLEALTEEEHPLPVDNSIEEPGRTDLSELGQDDLGAESDPMAPSIFTDRVDKERKRL